MLKENKILNGSLKPPQGSRCTFFRKPGQWTRWAAFDWNEKYEESFYSFHIYAGLLHGPSFNLAKSSSGSVFFLIEKNIFFWKRRGKISSFFNYPHLLHLLPPPQICLPRRKKPAGDGGGVLFSLALRPPSLSNSSRPPLLCMKHRSRLNAFSGHSETEEKRSSELY